MSLVSIQVRILFVVLCLILNSGSWCSCYSVNCSVGNDPRISWGRQIDCRRLGIANIPTGLPTVNVTSLLLDRNNIELVKYDDFKNFTDLRYLDLSSNQIGNISDDAFAGVRELIHLNLNFNQLLKWPGNAVSGLIRLKELYLDGATDITLGPLPPGFGDLTKLEKLVISDLRFGVISDEFFSKAAVSSVTFLDMSACTIDGVELGAFRNFTNIRTLKLNVVVGLNPTFLGNIMSDLDNTSLAVLDLFGTDGINKIDKSPFANFQHNVLKTLVLSYSAVGAIYPGAFRNLASLRELHLDFTELKEIKANCFNGLKSLTYLDVTGTKLNRYNFSGSELKNLKLLNVSYSSYLFHMKSRGFDRLGSLTELILENTNVEILEACVFCGLPNLTKLRMTYSNFERVDSNAFAGLTSLEVLDLTSSGIGYLNQSLFNSMTSLKSLTLDNNNFSQSGSVSADVFRILPNLTYLSMEFCQLSSDCGLFHHLTMLHTVTLNGNIGIQFSEHAFLGSSNLTTLVLSFTNTTTFLPSALNDLMLDYLDVSFDGLANISKMNVSYLHSAKLRRFAGRGNPYSCSCENLNFLIWFNKTNKVADSRDLYYCGDQLLVQFDVRKCTNMLSFIFSVTTSLVLIATVGILVAYLNRWYVYYIWYKLCRKAFNKLEMEEEKKIRDEAEYDAFISCTYKGAEFVLNHLIDKLENGPIGDQRFKLLFEERDFDLGVSKAEAIYSAVKSSRKTIIILTDDYIDEEWKMYEYETAYSRISKKERVVIVVLLGVGKMGKLPQTLVGLLSSDDCIEWPEEDKQGQEVFWQCLKDALNRPTFVGPTTV